MRESPVPSVPVVTFHSIADKHAHLFGHLSLPVSLFERQLEYLQRKGFTTVTLYDLYEYLRHGTSLPHRPIVLTLDDGYLDNWVHAFPLLKKHGMKATIFVITDFVDDRDRLRPTLDDVWAGRVDRSTLEWWGHASWPELLAMQESGLVDVQAHTRTHAWYFVSDRIVDFHHPAANYFWLHWNRYPHEKPAWLTRDYRAGIPWGTPVYEHDQTLLRPRFFDDPRLADALVACVERAGGERFFERHDWSAVLHAEVGAFRSRYGVTGRYETDAEYAVRVVDEMAGSRQIIEERLQKKVDFLCWPCGDYTPRLQRLAIEECGFLATVNVSKVTNRRGDDPTELRRIVFGQDYQGPCQSDLIFMNFVGNVNYHSGRLAAYPVAPIARRLMRVGRRLRRATAAGTV